MKYIYLGKFPPPYGGVTVKNKLLFDNLSEYKEIEQSKFFDETNNLLFRFFHLAKSLVNKRKGLIIGISKGSLKWLTYVLYFLNKKIMRKSVVMVMGGKFPEMVIEDEKLQKYIKEYKHLYVETNGMKDLLNSVMVNNVSVFPNCRTRPKKTLEVSKNHNPYIKCLFFSLISEDKGVDVVFGAAEQLKKKDVNFIIDFYGHIDSKFKGKFDSTISQIENLNYKGIFKSLEEDRVYEKLGEYDLLLFPTKWKNEGVPGVLVEAKIAGLPAIVSNINYNAELINNDMNGNVLENNTPLEMAQAIEKLYLDREKLIEMKNNAKKSGESFFIDNHIQHIIKKLETPKS